MAKFVDHLIIEESWKAIANSERIPAYSFDIKGQLTANLDCELYLGKGCYVADKRKLIFFRRLVFNHEWFLWAMNGPPGAMTCRFQP